MRSTKVQAFLRRFQVNRFFLILVLSCLAGSAVSENYQVISVRDELLGSPFGGSGDSGTPVISSDGRYVLFASAANNLVLNADSNSIPVESPAQLNVYLRDRSVGVTTLVSVDATGSCGGDGNSLPVQISTNGQFVLFESTASNLVSGDTNGVSDVFVRDMFNETTLLVSRAADGGVGNGVSHNPAMTPDGRFVAFSSAATNLTAGDSNGIPDIFVRDMLLESTILASVGATSPWSFSASESPDLTPNGQYVVFHSTATNLVAGVTSLNEIYVRDLVGGTTHWVSSNAASILQSTPGSHSYSSYNQRISADGQFVAYQANNYNSQNPITGRATIVRHHVDSGVTDVVATNGVPISGSTEAIVQNLDMTADGRFIAYLARTNNNAVCVLRWDAATGMSELVSGTLSNTVPFGSICGWPSINSSGRYVAFLCTRSLTTNSIIGGFGLYLRDMTTGITELINAGTDGVGAGAGFNAVPTLSDDGNVVTFECPDGTLIENDRNRAIDVLAKDLSSGEVEMISIRHTELPSLTANGPSFLLGHPVASTDGSLFVFASDADNLVPNDTNGVRDIFVRDLVAGTNTLATVATNGGAANGISTESAISGNGRYVAFTSYANNLAEGDTNKTRDVFVHDLLDRTTRLVSVSTNGLNSGNGDSFAPTISDSGRFVLFHSMARNLAPGPYSGSDANLFLWDSQAGTNMALTVGGGGSGAVNGSMTPDGRFIGFYGDIPGVVGAAVFVWDTELSARIYTNSWPFFGPAFDVSISPNGQRLAYVEGFSGAVLRVADLSSGTNRVLATSPFAARGVGRFSADGRFMAYATTARNSPDDNNVTADVYLHDFEAGTSVLVSRTASLPGTPNSKSELPDITPDGRFVVYWSEASNLVEGDNNNHADVFLYDRSTGTTTLLSASRFGTSSADHLSIWPKFSPDGSRVIWAGWASDQVALDHNHFSDIIAFGLPPTAIVDDDNDDMDDDWEIQYFMTKARDGSKDFDNDGASDLFEFQTGTNPKDADSLFRGEIVFMATSNPHAKLTWTSAPGKAYRIEWKNSIDDSEWQSLNVRATVLGATGSAIDPGPLAVTRYYRIVLIEPEP